MRSGPSVNIGGFSSISCHLEKMSMYINMKMKYFENEENEYEDL